MRDLYHACCGISDVAYSRYSTSPDRLGRMAPLDPTDAALRLAPEIPMAREQTRTQVDDGDSGKSTFRVIERGLVAAMPAGKAGKIGSTILETGNRAARANSCCRLFARALSDR
ncbi:MAG TPA: hypothetical protein VFN42_13395, partial [Acetobacteraceae bacterium]|nr:hypothetical protein [Acetobacteraceae bacterium]